MSISFENRVAIITGAGGGLGRAYALELATRGAKVVINDFGGSRDGSGGSSEAAEKVVAEIREKGGQAIADGGNVTRFEDMQALVARTLAEFGRIDILINNAGILRDKTFAKMDLDDFGPCSSASHRIGQCDEGCLGSDAGAGLWPHSDDLLGSGVYGNFGQSNYGAAKAGLIGLMNVAAFRGRPLRHQGQRGPANGSDPHDRRHDGRGDAASSRAGKRCSGRSLPGW